MLLLSTDSPTDLSVHNDARVRFVRELPKLAATASLAHANAWFLAAPHGCSCGLRHLYTGSVDLGFGEPEDWYEESADEIAATVKVAAIIRDLVTHGAQVDAIDCWNHQDAADDLVVLTVNLSAVNDKALRFFENHRFVFSA